MDGGYFCGLSCFVIIFFTILVVAGSILRVNEAKKEYLEALANLKNDPNNPDLRERTLALGRKYIAAAKGAAGTTTVDEIAIMNDINAACAGAILAKPEKGQTPDERLAKLDNLRAKNLVSDEEYQEQRKRILEDL